MWIVSQRSTWRLFVLLMRAICWPLFNELSQVCLLIYVGLKTLPVVLLWTQYQPRLFMQIFGIITFLNTSSTMGFPLYSIFCRYFWTLLRSGHPSRSRTSQTRKARDKYTLRDCCKKKKTETAVFLNSRILMLFYFLINKQILPVPFSKKLMG